MTFQSFLEFSAEATGFSTFELQGTGQAKVYHETVVGVVGEPLMDELLAAYCQIDASGNRQEHLRRRIFGHEKLGPVARSIIKLWYVGIWYQLPSAWSEVYGARERDGTFMASAMAYTVGLLWRATGTNPPGANAPGYGSWAAPPVVPGLMDAPDDAFAPRPTKLPILDR